MNKVILIGNLTRDPELTETSGSDGERKTDFFNCVAWRGLGETVARFTKKGTKVCVSGSIELRNYEDSQGVKRTGVDIVAQDVEFLTPRQGGGDDFGYDAPAQSNSGSSRGAKPQLQPFDDDGDIPF